MVSKNKTSPYKLPLTNRGEYDISKNIRAKAFSEIVPNLAKLRVSDVNKKPLQTSTTFIIPEKYQIGGGVHGVAYKVEYDTKLRDELEKAYSSSTGKVYSELPAINSKVIIKIQIQKNETNGMFINDTIRENLIHKKLSESSSCALVSNVNPVCISDYIPKFYMSFIIKSRLKYRSITVMDDAGDKTLTNFLRSSPSQKERLNIYVKVERAMCSLWLAGYVHADLHSSNIMIKNGDPKIIDFGFGVELPDNFKIKIAQFISKNISEGSNRSLGEIWTEIGMNNRQTLQNYTNKILVKRNYPGYNPDFITLEKMWNNISSENRKLIPLFRAKIWGLKTTMPTNLNNMIEELSPSQRINTSGLPTKTVWPTADQLRNMNNSNGNTFESSYPNFFKNLPSKLRNRLQKKSQSPSKQNYDSPLYRPNSPQYKSQSPSKQNYDSPLYRPNSPQYKFKSKSKSKSPNLSPLLPQNEIPNNSLIRHIDKVDKKGRDVFRNDKGSTYVMQNGKKIYVKKTFLPRELASERMIGTNKVNAKKRKIYENSSGSKYVISGDKRVRVKRVFNKNEEPKKAVAKSPLIEINKIDKKGRRIYRNSDGRAFVLQDGKKIYVKKMFTPKKN